MANKQALRELQERLAQRMQAARETTQTAHWLAVECAGQALLFPLKQAAEIFAPVPLKPVPYAKSWMLGVANLRGGLHVVVDLASFLGLRESGGWQEAQQARLVALNPELNINCALQVDKLLGLRGDEHMKPDDDEVAGHRPRFAGARLKDQQGKRWQVLDLEALSRHEQFLRIVD